MRKWLTGALIVSMMVAAIFWLGSSRSSGQARAYQAPRTADGKPNLNGIWQAVNTANWDLEAHAPQAAPVPELVGVYLAEPGGLGVVEGGSIPYKPDALARKKENFQKRLAIDPFNRDAGDPEVKCFLPGVPRATYMPFPFQIVQGTNQIWITYEYANASRHIPLKKQGPPPVDTWMGQSEGHWEGETLVVDVTGLNGKSWLDRAGNFTTETVRVVERYTPMSADALMYEATITDPAVFTRPWKISMPLYRRLEKNMQLVEFKCVPFAEPILYHTLEKPSAP
jgi:hypothetical protein